MEESAQNKNNSKTGLCVAIAILATVVVGLVIALLVILLTRSSCECSDKQEQQTEDEQGDDFLSQLQRGQRNTQREDDISRFLTAANGFQTNNSGKTPWYGDRTNEKWVPRYVDSNCSYNYSIDNIEFYDCRVGSTEFRDPDGQVYRIRYVGDISENYDLNSVMKAWPNNHEIVVATNATCGNNDTFETGTGSRQYAMAYRLEGGSITCNDNH